MNEGGLEIKLTAVRHGTATHNENGTFAGSHQTELTDMGIRQAYELANSLLEQHRQKPYDVILTSELIRAQQTAEIIHDTLGLEMPIKIDARLNEQNFGNWQGQRIEELKTRGLLPNIGSERWYKEKPGVTGEAMVELADRVKDLLIKIHEEYASRNILLVTHGGVIQQLISQVYDYAPYQGAPGSKPFKHHDILPSEYVSMVLSIDKNGNIEIQGGAEEANPESLGDLT